MWREQIFEYFIFALSIVQKPAKIVIFAIFRTLSFTCYKKPKKRKFKNVLPSSFLHPLCANFQVIWSNCQRRIAFSRLFFLDHGQNTAFLSLFWTKWPCSSLTVWHLKISWRFAQRYFTRVQKLLWSKFLNFCFFGYLVRKVPNIRNIAILAGVCAINSAKMRN